MKKNYTLAAVMITALALSFTTVEARSLDALKPKPVQSIEQQIVHKLRMLPNYGVFDHITFQVNGPIVTLSGKVISLGTRGDAAASVKRIPGVERVINNIEDLPPSPSDRSIRRQTLRALADKGLSGYFWEPNPSMRIIVDRGHISLEGYVRNKGDYNLANIIANGVPGVFSVTNNLIVGKQLS